MSSSDALSHIEQLTEQPPTDANERRRVYTAARELLYATESQGDLVQRLLYTPTQLIIANVAVKLGLFRKLLDAPKQTLTIDELASTCGTDIGLMRRLMRGLAAFGMAKQIDENSFTAVAALETLTMPGVEAGIQVHIDLVERTKFDLPNYLERRRYKNPTDATDSLVQAVHGAPAWDWMARPENASVARNFAMWMGAQRTGQNLWLDVFPAEQYLSGVEPNDVLFVDVGGNRGHQALDLKQRHPKLAGKVVVQDMEAILENADKGAISTAGIELMPHDFFTPQPLQGARCYYLRNIFHDHPDDRCVQILKSLMTAMTKDSFILIDDMVIPAVGAPWQSVQLDWTMMMLPAVERTRSEWKTLIEDKAGMVMEKVWIYDEAAAEGLLLCRKV